MSYDLPAPASVCSASGVPLRPGDRFVGTLGEANGRYVRKDYAADAWREPPPGTFAWWRGRIPATKNARKPKLDDAPLLDCFDRMADAKEPAAVNFRYVLALLLVRRRRFRFDDAAKPGVLAVVDGRDGRRIEVADPNLDDVAVESVQAEIERILA